MTHHVDWLRMSWREPFMRQRLAAMLGSSLLLAAICLTLRAGLLALLAPLVGGWPWTIRISIEPGTMTLRWLFVRQSLPLAQLTSVRVGRDPRRWSWPKAPVLTLERRDRSPICVFGREPILEQLGRELAERLGEAPGSEKRPLEVT